MDKTEREHRQDIVDIGRLIYQKGWVAANDGNITIRLNNECILSTPTGSTAYALATGGPILPPELRNILMLPMAPHLSMDRPIVLARGAVVDIEPTRENRHAVVLTVDGKVEAELDENQHVCITSAEPVSQFARLRERNYFYRSLLDRLEPRINRHGPRRMTFNE